MDEQSERTALLSALTTEHFVLQTANNSTYSEASSARLAGIRSHPPGDQKTEDYITGRLG